MFKKHKAEDMTQKNKMNNDDLISAPPLKPFSKKGSHHPSKPTPAPASHHDIHLHSNSDLIPSRRIERVRPGDVESRRLVIGRGICLKGEITSCDKLVVEGTVEVTLSNARYIEVTASGFFKGCAKVKEADISGQFDGELTADEKLTVRGGGRISGTTRYGNIIIESGGEISGKMEALVKSDDNAVASHPGIPKKKK